MKRDLSTCQETGVTTLYSEDMVAGINYDRSTGIGSSVTIFSGRGFSRIESMIFDC